MKDNTMQPQNLNEGPASTDDLREELRDALLHTYNRINANTSKIYESATFLYALIELLCEKEGIAVEELDERKKVVGERLAQEFRAKGMGAMLQEPGYDKYTFESGVEIDCETRVQFCKAAGCRLPFALSTQDIREGIVRWNLARPYMIEQGADGYCNHLKRGTHGCTVYKHRPVPCRAFDCQNDKRIWLDFEKRIPNPAVDRPDYLEYVSHASNYPKVPLAFPTNWLLWTISTS